MLKFISIYSDDNLGVYMGGNKDYVAISQKGESEPCIDIEVWEEIVKRVQEVMNEH